MAPFIGRGLIALALAVLLWVQTRKMAPDLRHRRRAFELTAAALLSFAILNGSLALGAEVGRFHIVVTILGGVLLLTAFVAFVISWRAGEMKIQRDRIAEAAREYRKSRGWPDKEG